MIGEGDEYEIDRVKEKGDWERRWTVRVRGWDWFVWERGWVREWRLRARRYFKKKTSIWNQVLETRFLGVLGGCHVGNWVLKTQFPGRPPARSNFIKTWKSSFKNSIYRPKIESLILEMLVNYIVSKSGLLTI